MAIVCNSCDWSKCFNTKIHPLKVEFKYIFFRKLPFCRFMHSLDHYLKKCFWLSRKHGIPTPKRQITVKLLCTKSCLFFFRDSLLKEKRKLKSYAIQDQIINRYCRNTLQQIWWFFCEKCHWIPVSAKRLVRNKFLTLMRFTHRR